MSTSIKIPYYILICTPFYLNVVDGFYSYPEPSELLLQQFIQLGLLLPPKELKKASPPKPTRLSSLSDSAFVSPLRLNLFQKPSQLGRLWAEIYCHSTKKWIATEFSFGKYNCSDEMAGKTLLSPSIHRPANPKMLITKMYNPNMKMNLKTKNDMLKQKKELSQPVLQFLQLLPKKKDLSRWECQPAHFQMKHEVEEESASLGFELSTAWKGRFVTKQPPKLDSIQSSETHAYRHYFTSPSRLSHSKQITSEKQKKYKNVILPSTGASAFSYILSCNQGGLLRDVTRRYTQNWHTLLTLRSQELHRWWEEETLPKLQPTVSDTAIGIRAIDRVDEAHLEALAQIIPFPTSKIEFKTHPRVVLASLLTSRQFLAPKAPVVGYFKGEKVFARQHVWTLRSRTQWEELEREILPNQEPMKWVTYQPMGIKLKHSLNAPCFTDSSMRLPVQTLPLYAWNQTQEMQTQIKDVLNRKIPVNARGNVDLRGKKNVPKGTLHLRGYQGIEKIAKKYEIEAPQALIGFEIKDDKIHPKFDGVVILQEDQERLLLYYQSKKKKCP